MDESKVDEMISEVDIDGDGAVRYEANVRSITKSS